jgi:hypothetical protein
MKNTAPLSYKVERVPAKIKVQHIIVESLLIFLFFFVSVSKESPMNQLSLLKGALVFLLLCQISNEPTKRFSAITYDYLLYAKFYLDF